MGFMDWLSGGAYSGARNAYNQAGTDASKLGADQRDWYGNQTNRAQGFYGGANQAYGNMAGQLGGPGYLENLYNRRASGQDTDYNNAYAYQMQKGMAGIGQQGAYAGSANSSGNSAQKGAFEAEMAGQRANQMGQLAQGAQAEKSGRLGQIFGAGMGLGGQQSGLQMQGAGMGGQAYGQGQMAGIEARLQAAGIGMQEWRDLMGGIGGLAQGAGSYLGGK